MKQFNSNITGIGALVRFLNNEELPAVKDFNSLLVQIFSAKNDPEWYTSIGIEIRKKYTNAVIIGASSVGEIIDAKSNTNSTSLLFSFFESSEIDLFSYECEQQNEIELGAHIIQDVEASDIEIKGMLLLSTPISNDSGTIFNNITRNALNYPVFGGGAGDYANQRNTLIYDGSKCIKNGILAVLFSGKELHIELLSSLGWIPLSKEMTFTDAKGAHVTTIDNEPAFSVYEKYLGIKADENFFQNSLEFPFLIYRNNQMLARTPFFANESDGSIQLVADVKAGEKFRIGYGNPHLIKMESSRILEQMDNFQPEAIYLYSCICRRFLMQEEVDQETLPFKTIAPTAGFYTFGEFYADCNFNSLLNSSLVAIGIREGEKRSNLKTEKVNENLWSDQEKDPYYNQHNRILSRLLYFIEQLIKEYEEQNKVLKNLIDQKNEFLGMAAHDLRTPLSAIHGFSELLEEQVDYSARESISIINRESTKMLHLLNDLLDISKIEAGKLDLKKAAVDYPKFIDQVAKTNNFIAQNKNIRIITSIDPFVPQTINIDEGKMEQVLNNLLSNAIKFSFPFSLIRIKVSLNGNSVITEVVDHGQGIPENEIDQIFKAFKKTSVRPTAKESSHGLGLAIVKKIIEGHNGTIQVKSKVGEGSTFSFTLPI